jgi:hypothetical protein
MGAQNEKAHNLGIKLLEHLTNREEVTQGFRHFFVVDPDKTVVHPVIDESTLVRPFRLGDFVFVVRELQILPATVNIEVLAENFRAHRRAFNVPARSPLTPR